MNWNARAADWSRPGPGNQRSDWGLVRSAGGFAVSDNNSALSGIAIGDNQLKGIMISSFCMTCLLAVGISGSAQAANNYSFSFSSSNSSSNPPRTTTNRPWGNLGAYKQSPKYEQSAPPGNQYYPAAAPGTSWYQAQAPVPAAAAVGNSQPRVEVEVSGRTFYEQQNIVYTARVISSDNLKTLNPVMPRVEGAVLEQLDGPIASERNSGRNREIVNEYRFKLMPLQSGDIEIPAIGFTGTRAVSRQWPAVPGRQAATDSSFSIAAGKPLKLMVLPADQSVTPWLPLHDLKLRAQMPEDSPAREGIPVTLTLELTAKGARGDQLPSLEAQLKSEYFRVYRDSTTTSSGVSNDGKQLLGTRKETYTLIPLRDGWIRLPQVQVAWWDVDSDSAMVAGLAGQDSLVISSETAQQAAATEGVFSDWFWVPWLVTVSLILGYWLGAWARTRPIFSMVRARAGAVYDATAHRVQGYARVVSGKLSPQVYWNRLRLGFALLMPKSVRMWMCTRCLEPEVTPEAWCQEFKARVCQQLNISRHTPLPVLAEKIIEANPQAEPAQVRALAQSLDGAIYGGKPLDFAAWKRDFRQQLRPRLVRRHRQRSRPGRVLPELNPHAA